MLLRQANEFNLCQQNTSQQRKLSAAKVSTDWRIKREMVINEKSYFTVTEQIANLS